MPLFGKTPVVSFGRFSTPTSRFKLAVGSGFVMTLIGVASIGFGPSGFAQGMFDLFGGGFGAQPQSVAPAVVAGQAYYDEDGRRHRRARRHRGDMADDSDRPRHSRHHVAKRDKDGNIIEASTAGYSTGRSMCVRLCDGFAFPIGDYNGPSDRPAHEATCHAQCPGAATALYVMPAGSDTLATAVSVSSGKTYSQLPDAFHYTTVIDSACSCHPDSGTRSASILRDFTLRRGDAVMTQTGFKVFHGGAGQYPFKRRDFLSLAQSRDVTPLARQTFKTIEKASMMTGTTVAERLAPKPTAVSLLPVGAKRYEHQASR